LGLALTLEKENDTVRAAQRNHARLKAIKVSNILSDIIRTATEFVKIKDGYTRHFVGRASILLEMQGYFMRETWR